MPGHQVVYCEDCAKPYCIICDPECPNCRENLPTITVCSKCKMACCWQGVFVCNDAVSASTVKMSMAQLRVLDLENSCYWLTDEELARL